MYQGPEGSITGQKGFSLLFLFLIVVAIAAIFMTIHVYKLSQEQAIKNTMQRKNIGVKCKKAIRDVRTEMEIEKKLTGKYPYEFNEEFLDRHGKIERYLFNRELWSPLVNHELKLKTTFGENYQLTGYCKDWNIYFYDSYDDELLIEPYSAADFEETP